MRAILVPTHHAILHQSASMQSYKTSQLLNHDTLMMMEFWLPILDLFHHCQ